VTLEYLEGILNGSTEEDPDEFYYNLTARAEGSICADRAAAIPHPEITTH